MSRNPLTPELPSVPQQTRNALNDPALLGNQAPPPNALMGAPSPVEQNINLDEVASAILEVASIQVDLMRQIERASADRGGGGVRFEVSGATRWQSTPLLQLSPLVTRAQTLIQWLLARLPNR